MKKLVLLPVVVGLVGGSLFAQSNYIQNLNNQIQNNQQLIKQYTNAIKKLQQRNKFLLQQRNRHPLLYKQLPAFSNTKKAYIYRIELNGQRPQNIKFQVDNGMLSLSMNMQQKQQNKNSFFESSQYFYQSFMLPKDVNVKDITHKIIGNYFVITIPKK